MLAVLNHPSLVHDWFTTTLLRWHGDGLVIYERWVLNTSGISEWSGSGGAVLLDFYYLCYLIAFLGVLFFFSRYRKKGWIKVKPHVAYDALLLAMIGVLVGAKTAYIFIYNPDFYFGPPPYGPVDTGDQLQRIFLNWSGMASHGAAAGVLMVAFLWWLKARPKLPMAHIGDIGGISSAFGAIWIRLANFMNGELYGRAAGEGLPWAMRFPVRSGKGNRVEQYKGELWERLAKPDDPSQYEAWIAGLRETNPGGVMEIGEQISYVYFRNPDAYLQGYQVMSMQGEPVFHAPEGVPEGLQNTFLQVVTTPRHPSQLYQLLLEGVLVLALLLLLRPRVKRAGMLVAGFWTAYPLARFIGEFFRQPDVQFQEAGNAAGTILLGLSMGQILSLLMACIGFAFFLYFRKKGKVIAEMEMYPPDKEEDEDDRDENPMVPFEKGMGGSTGAGEIAGLSEVREALKKKEAEWEAEAAELPDENEEETDDDDKAGPEKPERGD